MSAPAGALRRLFSALVAFIRQLGWALLARLLSAAHPTNASGNNMSQR